MSTVLVVEHDIGLREELRKLLSDRGHGVLAASDGEEALEQIRNNTVQLVIASLNLPKMNGSDLLHVAHETEVNVPFIMIAEQTVDKSALDAIGTVVADSIFKPVSSSELLTKVERVLENAAVLTENAILRAELERKLGPISMIGASPALDGIRALIKKVAPTRSPVLITGEFGTGKELIARTIHALSSDKNQPFVPFQCSAHAENMLESLLFGHQRGAFVGAAENSPGLLRSARGGTLFLDEVADFPPALQAKLLRALEDRRIQPIGSSHFVPFDARIVASTSRRLRDEVDKKNFREDLYFRLAVLELHSPPLRERRDDIPLLAAHFIRRLNRELNRSFTGIEEGAMRNLVAAPWKGNVRELRNLIERAMIIGTEPLLRGHDLLSSGQPPVMPIAEMKDLKDAVSVFERDHIRRIIAERHGDKRAAARDLGISLSSLYRHLDLKGPV